MKDFENFSTMNADQLREANGGGFAYDFGRVLRFIVLSGGGSSLFLPNAVADWTINEAVNEAANY